ncbi:MAG: hypothetical protein Q9187_007928 [Circinaria calcarea]
MLYSILHTIFVVISFVQVTIIAAKADVTKPVHDEVPFNDSNLPASLFKFTLTDSTGEDISSNVTILHNYRNLPSPTTRKRAASRIINQCPPQYRFAYSHCNRGLSPQSCHPTEFCVDPGKQASLYKTAFCISTNDFVVLARNEMERSMAAGAGQLGIPPTGQKVYAVEAILTGLDPHRSVIAQSMRIQAMRYGTFHGGPAWLPVRGGDSHCKGCASTGMVEVPDGTERFEVYVVLGARMVVGGAMLWITAFKP